MTVGALTLHSAQAAYISFGLTAFQGISSAGESRGASITWVQASGARPERNASRFNFNSVMTMISRDREREK